MSNLPTAIATGADAATPDAISPVRTGIGAGVLAAVLVFVTFVVVPVPSRALSLAGGDGSDIGRAGGMRIVWVPPAGVDAHAIEQTFASRHRGARITRDRAAFVVEVAGTPPAEVARAAKLVVAGGVAFHRSVIAPEMTALARDYGVPFPRYDEQSDAPVRMEIDQWQPEDGGQRRTDFYLWGHRREDIEATFADAHAKGWRLPEGTRIAYEHVDGWDGKPDFWRSYVIETAVALGGDRVADAVGSYDPNTNRPIVLLDFDREGARIFGEVTASMVGEKLATLLGGDVVSAPIINGPIRGGRASITMGGSDVVKQEQERDALIGVLRAGQLPAGGSIHEATYIPPSTSAVSEWLARVLLGFGAGLLVGLLAWALVRKTRPVWRTPEVRLPGSIPWARAGVMLIAPLAVIGASFITAPGLDTEQILYALRDDSQFSIGMLGISPLISSFIVVELAAMVVPSWRRRRHAGRIARLPLDLAVLVGAVVLSIVQAWFVAVYLERVDAAPVGLDRLLFLASVSGATLAFAGIAAVIRRYGLGNGFAALLAAGFAYAVYQQIDRWTSTPAGWREGPAVTTGEIVLVFVTLLIFGAVMVVGLRWRIARVAETPLRIPTSGFAPLGEAQGVLGLIFVALGMIPIAGLTEAMYDAQIWLHDLHRGIAIALVVVFVVVWSWAFAHPDALRPYAERAKLGAPSIESWRSATLLSAGLLVLIAAGHTFLSAFHTSSVLGTMALVMFGAVVLDVYDDLRGRRGKLERAWALHGAQHADIAAHVLAGENIAFHMTGANMRTLLAWFGPFVPVDVWVRREDAVRARELLANVFAPG